MFQLEPVQLCHSLLREIHCCCEPESTLPSMRESEIQPPLAQPRFWWSTRSPRMCMRRKGTACETAHCMVPPVGVTEKPSTARQKVQVALLCGRLASEWTLPVMWTASGDGAEADDFGVEADRDVDVVVAGKKEQGVALGAELVVLLDGVDLVDLRLNVGGGHGGTEDQYVGTEVGSSSVLQRRAVRISR